MKTYRSKLNRFKNLDRFSTHQVKALFGFHPTVLAEILLRRLAGVGAAARRATPPSALIGSSSISTMTNAQKRHRGAESKWNPEEIDRLIIDSFETPVTRGEPQ